MQMCMLYVKPENFTMPQDYLESLKAKNADGLAFYNKKDGSVFKTLDYNAGFKYMEDNHDNELVVHFRFGTSGDDGIDQLHGFDICNDDYILFHNGVLSSVNSNPSLGWSDTQVLVNIFRDEPVEKLINYLEKHERSSRFLIVDKKTKEYIIPKCATWSGDATINGVKILFSNSYAIGSKFLDNGFTYGSRSFTNTVDSSGVTANLYSTRWKGGVNDNSSFRDYYEDLWGGDVDDFEDEVAISEEEEASLTLELLDVMWKDESKKAINFIKLYPDIAHKFIKSLMVKNDIDLPF